MGWTEAELSISLVSDPEIADLAGRFGREPVPTDVLAFSALEGPGAENRDDCVGDVIVSVETAERQARGRGHTLDTELCELVIHGVLHLLGMDHDNAGDTRRMRELEAHLKWETERF